MNNFHWKQYLEFFKLSFWIALIASIVLSLSVCQYQLIQWVYTKLDDLESLQKNENLVSKMDKYQDYRVLLKKNILVANKTYLNYSLGELIELTQETLDQSGLQLIRIDLSNPTTKATLHQATMKLKVKGDYLAFKRWIEVIERGEYIFNINSFSVKSTKNTLLEIDVELNHFQKEMYQ